MGIGAGYTAADIVVTAGERAGRARLLTPACPCSPQDLAKTPIKLRRKSGPDTFEDASEHVLGDPALVAEPERRPIRSSTDDVRPAGLGARLRGIIRVDGRIERSGDSIRPHHRRSRRGPAQTIAPRWRTARRRHGRSTRRRPPIFDTLPSPIGYCRDLIGTAIALQATSPSFSRTARGWAACSKPTAARRGIRNLRESLESKDGRHT